MDLHWVGEECLVDDESVHSVPVHASRRVEALVLQGCVVPLPGGSCEPSWGVLVVAPG